jgi:hypothetical protein
MDTWRRRGLQFGLGLGLFLLMVLCRYQITFGLKA